MGRGLKYSILFIYAFSMGCSGDRMGVGSIFNTSTQCAANKTSTKSVRKITSVQPVEIVTATGLNQSQIVSACKSALNYSCSARIFDPNVSSNEKRTVKQCSKIEVLGKPCFDVDTTVFSTSHLLKVGGIDPKEFLPGGDYNQSEFICSNQALGVDPSKIVGRESSFDDALMAAYMNCINVKPGVK